MAASSCRCYFLKELIGLKVGPLDVIICLFCQLSRNDYDDCSTATSLYSSSFDTCFPVSKNSFKFNLISDHSEEQSFHFLKNSIETSVLANSDSR